MRKNSTSRKPYLSPGDVAAMLMVSPASVRLWASKGALKSVTTPGGHRRFMPDEIERFAREKNLTIQPLDDDTLRVLIVDDDPQVTDYLSRYLSRVDANVKTMKAHDGFAAGTLVQVFEPHVVLLDLMMPGLDGFDVCTKIKGDPKTRAIRIIAMTSFHDDGNVKRALRAGAECCVEKPFDTKSLLALLGLRVPAG